MKLLIAALSIAVISIISPSFPMGGPGDGAEGNDPVIPLKSLPTEQRRLDRNSLVFQQGRYLEIERKDIGPRTKAQEFFEEGLKLLEVEGNQKHAIDFFVGSLNIPELDGVGRLRTIYYLGKACIALGAYQFSTVYFHALLCDPECLPLQEDVFLQFNVLASLIPEAQASIVEYQELLHVNEIDRINSWKVNNCLGNIFHVLGIHKWAQLFYERSLNDSKCDEGNRAELQEELGHILLKMRKYKEAAQFYESAAGSQYYNDSLIHRSQCYHWAGCANFSAGMYEEASRCYVLACVNNEWSGIRRSESHFGLATAQLVLGRQEVAHKFFAKVVKCKSTNPFYRARAAEKLGDYSISHTFYKQGLAYYEISLASKEFQGPRRGRTLYKAGELARTLRDYDLAEAYLREAQKISIWAYEHGDLALASLAYILGMQSKYKEAFDILCPLFQRVSKVEEKTPLSLSEVLSVAYNLGFCLCHLTSKTEQRPILDVLYKTAQEDAEPLYIFVRSLVSDSERWF
jgi:tetratricopeptide (TPR) repeat protein